MYFLEKDTLMRVLFLQQTRSLSYATPRMIMKSNNAMKGHPDGQYICYLPAPILKEMNIVDTPGTNVILQRQKRLTEEFVPRADMLLFVFSADKPFTESEVAYLRYIQRWNKKVVSVLNKSDIYWNSTTSKIQNDIIGPALTDAQKLLGEYVIWLKSNSSRGGKLYKESFEKRWTSVDYPTSQIHLETHDLEKQVDLSTRVTENFSAGATSKLFEKQMREVFLGTFGGEGAAGLSASLLTSVLPTTLEDLLVLGLCTAGGFLAISSFPARRQAMVDQVNRIADGLAREVEEAMQKDLMETVGNLENFVKTTGKPYQDAAQKRLDKLLDHQEELSNVDKKT